MEDKYYETDYRDFVRELHPNWRMETADTYAMKLIDLCEILGITLKDFRKSE